MIIPLPTYTVRDDPPVEGEVDYKWIRWYVNCPPWKCVQCGAVMFGRMKYCVYCKVRLGMDTQRPSTYMENEYDPSV